MPGLYNHDDLRVVQRCFPAVHQEQVEQFSHNVSKQMINFISYRHIPDLELRISHLDPMQRNHPDNAETRMNIGGTMSKRAKLYALAMYS